MELSSAVLPSWTSPILLLIITGLLSVIFTSMRTFMADQKVENKANAAAMNITATKVEVLEKQFDKISDMGDAIVGLKYAVESYIKKKGSE